MLGIYLIKGKFPLIKGVRKMELVSEMIAIDDEAKRMVSEAREYADGLKETSSQKAEQLRQENKAKLEELEKGLEEGVLKAAEEARTRSARFEAQKRAELDEYFSAHADELADKIVSDIYKVD